MTDLTSTARRRELGAELRRLRERLGLKGNDMAARLEWTPCQLSRVETGKRTMNPLDVIRYAAVCGLSITEQEHLFDLASEPDHHRVKHHNGTITDQLRTLIFQESTASTIEVFEPTFMPGLLQTEDYIRALFEETGKIDPADVDDLVAVRLGRRQVLTRIYPAQSAFYVHEFALRMPVGGPCVMNEQMLHLLFACSRPQCSIRVVPASARGRGAGQGSFHIFGYPEGVPVVYLQHETASEFLEDRKELIAYRSVMNRVASVALDEARSREFIASMASEYERQGAAHHDRLGGLAQE